MKCFTIYIIFLNSNNNRCLPTLGNKRETFNKKIDFLLWGWETSGDFHISATRMAEVRVLEYLVDIYLEINSQLQSTK